MARTGTLLQSSTASGVPRQSRVGHVVSVMAKATMASRSRLRTLVAALCLTAMASPLSAQEPPTPAMVAAFPSQLLEGAVFPKDKYPLLIENAGIASGYNYYFCNQWRQRKGDARAGHVMTFSGRDIKIRPSTPADDVPWKLKSAGKDNQYTIINQWRADAGGDERVDYHLSFSGSMCKLYPETAVADIVPWEFQRVPETQDQYYIINHWKEAENESRVGMAMSFSGNDVKLYPSTAKGDWAPWQLIPVKPISGTHGVECRLYSEVKELEDVLYKNEKPEALAFTLKIEEKSGFSESVEKTKIFEKEITEGKETQNSVSANMEAAYGAVTVGIEASHSTTTTSGKRDLSRSELTGGIVRSKETTRTQEIPIPAGYMGTISQVIIDVTIYRAWTVKGEKTPFYIESVEHFQNRTNIRR